MKETIFKLKEWQANIISDLSSTWIENEDARLMNIQLQLLNQSIANLELIASMPDSQVFSSSIPL